MNLEQFQQAESVVRRFFPPTPLLEARRLSRRLGFPLSLKLDCYTPIRTFKLRGALVKLHALEALGMTGGVITASAGNHGLAVARAARLFGKPATVVVPEQANPQKVEAIEAEGARVLHHGRDYQDANEFSLELAARDGLHHVHAYNDPDIIAGQGTLGLELEPCDAVLCGVGGGGLISGVAGALKARFPAIRILGAQPQGADSMVRSCEAGRVVELERVQTIADGLGARQPGKLTLAMVRQHVEQVVRVADEDLIAAMRLLLREERIIAEPAGVAGLAALLKYPGLVSGRVTVVITGGNISDGLLAHILKD